MLEIQKRLDSIENNRDKLGEMIYDCIQEDTNFTTEIGKYVMQDIMDCKTERELEIVNNVLISITGYSIETLIEKINKRDMEGYYWESIE